MANSRATRSRVRTPPHLASRILPSTHQARLYRLQEDRKRRTRLFKIAENVRATEFVRRTRYSRRITKVDGILREPRRSAHRVGGFAIEPPDLVYETAQAVLVFRLCSIRGKQRLEQLLDGLLCVESNLGGPAELRC